MISTGNDLERATQSHRQGNLTDAQQLYRRVLEADPDVAEAWYQLGVIAYQARQYQIASEHLQEAITRRGDVGRYHLHLAAALRNQGLLARAEVRCRQGLAFAPHSFVGHELLAHVLEEQGCRGEALEAARAAVQFGPRSIDAHWTLARLFHDAGLLDEAISACEALFRIDPNHAAAHRMAAKCQAQRGRKTEMVKHARRAAELCPESAADQNNLGVALSLQSDFSSAAAAFDRAVELESENPHFHVNRAGALDALGRHRDALPSWASAASRLPDDLLVHIQSARSLREAGELDEAAALCGQALRIDASSSVAWNELGLTLERQGRHEEAVQAYQRVIEREPQVVAGYYNLGVAQAACGQQIEAIESWERALQIAPELPQAHARLAEGHQQAGNVRGAAWHLEQLARIVSLPDPLVQAGRMWLNENDWLAAESCFDKALELDDAQPTTRWLRGQSRLALGKLTEGWSDMEARLELNGPAASQPEGMSWQGESLTGQTLLVLAESSLSDMLFHLRWLEPLSQQSGRIMIHCPPQIAPLLEGLAGVDKVVTGDVSLPHYNFYIPAGSIPAVWKSAVSSGPKPGGYLEPTAETAARWGEQLGRQPGLKVGICCPPAGDGQVYAELEAGFAALARLDGIRPFALGWADQSRNVSTDLLAVATDLREPFRNLVEAVAILRSLDLVVGWDPVAAHLAGALGIPCCLTVLHGADWRWSTAYEAQPWYRSVRTFRSARAGDWDDVLQRIRSGVERLSKA